MATHSIHPNKLTMIREAEKSFMKNRKEIMKMERTQKDFPFSRYFLGGQKPERPVFKPDWKSWSNEEITMAWIGHSTVLVNFFGMWILTDPVFSERVGIRPLGIMTIGPRRMVDIPIKMEELPRIDLILLSHAHMDHTDMPTLRKLRNARHVAVAKNTLDIYAHLKFADCQELEWGETIQYENGVTLEAIEVKHFGWRYPWEPCRGRNENAGRSFNGYYVSKVVNGKKRGFTFGGDTSYTDTFAALGDRLRKEGTEIDVAIMPIGAYNPWVGAHCNPEMAWQMTKEMNAKRILPVHWNTFTQSSEPRFEPIEWLKECVDEPGEIALLNIGETWSTDPNVVQHAPAAYTQPTLSSKSHSSKSRNGEKGTMTIEITPAPQHYITDTESDAEISSEDVQREQDLNELIVGNA